MGSKIQKLFSVPSAVIVELKDDFKLAAAAVVMEESMANMMQQEYDRLHIHEGDTLWSLSSSNLKSGRYWPYMYEGCKDIMGVDPRALPIGCDISICIRQVKSSMDEKKQGEKKREQP
eukprot:TRINITY_DN2772_c0_g1_i2.p1 TRINITY_DN2772_c0_g1~~TRINITY_DN2772_c0_g1_i2.p1  ORF type:complete len:118 (+),score=21.46 TRINITY_DN2772_c0_g1_i2:300-653(+)